MFWRTFRHILGYNGPEKAGEGSFEAKPQDLG